MGVSKTHFKCPCCDSNQRETFHKIIELKGLVIYHGTVPTINLTRDADSGNATENDTDTEHTPSTKGNVYILLNTKDDKITPGTIMRQFDKNVISCPRCRQILEHACERMQTIPVIEERNIIGICDHCYFNAVSILYTRGACVCKREVKTFLSTHERPFGGVAKNMKMIIQSWLSELDHVLNKKDSKMVLQKVICRSRSEVDISLYRRRVKNPREPKIQMMFYDGKSVSDTECVKKEEHTRDFVEHSNLKRSHKTFNNRMSIMSEDTENVSNKTYSKGLHNLKQEDSDLIKEKHHILQSKIIDDRSYQDKDIPKRSTMKTDTILENKLEKTDTNYYLDKERQNHLDTSIRQEKTKIIYKKPEQISQNEQIPKKKAEHFKTKRETNKNVAGDIIKIKDKQKEPISNKGKVKDYPVNVEDISVDIKEIIKNRNQSAKHKISLKKTDTYVDGEEKKEKRAAKHKDSQKISKDTVKEKRFISKNYEDMKEKSKKKVDHSKTKQETNKNKPDYDNIKTKENRKELISNIDKKKDLPSNIQDISIDIKDIMKNINQSARNKDSLLKKTEISVKEIKDSKYDQGVKGKNQKQPKLEVEGSKIKHNSNKEDGALSRNITKDLLISEEKQKSFKSQDKVKTVKKVDEENNVQEVKVSPNKLKLQKPSGDDLILKLIQIHQSTYVPREKHEDDKIINKVHEILKIRSCQNHVHDKLEVECDDEIHNEKEAPEFQDIIIGEQVCQYKLPFLRIQTGVERVKPMIFQSNLKDELETPKYYKGIPNQLEDETENLQLFDDASANGIIRYALSNRSFIQKGWTTLPMEKVVRKMNIYRMSPAHPEFDWFEHYKNKGPITYDTGEKLAEIDADGHGRWYYRNGRLALDYYDAEETNALQRFVVYSSGERDERGRLQPVTLLATFDYLGNGVVFDHAGKILLKYNQTEGVMLDRSIGPVSHWKWHSLNDPPVLQQVMIDNQLAHKDPTILKMGDQSSKKSVTRTENDDMLAIEFENFIKEKGKKLTQKFKPFQIKMKALKINEHFSLRVLDQASIYLIFRDGSTNLKINIGMILNHQEIVDTDIAEVGEVSNSMEHFPAKTDSIAQLQQRIAHAQRYERMRTERERTLHPQQPCESADNLTAAASRPLRPPLRTKPMTQTESTSNTAYCSCSRKPSNNLYYDTRLS